MFRDDDTAHITYESSGVSIDRGNRAVELIKPLAQSTRRSEVVTDVGGFAGAFKLGQEEILAGADGVGSKLLLAQQLEKYDTIGIDLVAMNVNDVLASGGEPLFFLDYLAMGRIVPERVRDLVSGMVEGCRQAGCALLGGETSEMPDLYHENHFDLSGFAVGRRVYRADHEPSLGDVVLGIAASGFHSNGYQLIRTILEKRKIDMASDLLGQPIGDVLLTPTRIYVSVVRDLWETCDVRAMAHITGGGLRENLPRTLGSVGVELVWDSWPILPEMRMIQDWGNIPQDEMLRTFNCGIGFTIVLPPNQVIEAQRVIEKHGMAAYAIGTVVDKEGVTVR